MTDPDLTNGPSYMSVNQRPKLRTPQTWIIDKMVVCSSYYDFESSIYILCDNSWTLYKVHGLVHELWFAAF